MNDSANIDRLFVYGTLAPGRSNHEELSDLDGDWQAATVNGRLFEEGWGAEHGCPGLIPADGEPAVEGYVFRSAELAEHWGRLDAFEGSDYVRVTTTATLLGGETVNAYVYAIKRAV